ncbi:glycosyltransferase [Vibrio alginolyticus]|uniref:glycosyltransferase n=1 Tax=Vibrio chagasii TaxID=170679 RepID=UPI001EFCD5B4|nr:glycosyltransferase [Vibrio chagasii]MCG9606870.1 glycosyltransferase [Vibrio chagasii]MDE9382885.1 glycosyltransferase [Vibrio alginolyticus]
MLLSIVIPLYYPSDNIVSTIDSLKNQTSDNFELIFVNDGTPEEKLKVFYDMIQDLEFSYTVLHQRNIGVSGARNNGLLSARGDYVLFLDSDDVIHEQYIETIEKHLQNDLKVDALVYDCIIETDNGELVFDSTHKNKDNFPSDNLNIVSGFLSEKIYINVMSIVHRVEHLKNNNIHFDINLKNGEDQEFNIKSLYYSDKTEYISRVLCKYIKHSKSYTSQEFEMSKFGILDKYNSLVGLSSQEEFVLALDKAKSRDIIYTLSNISKLQCKESRKRYFSYWFDNYSNEIEVKALSKPYKLVYFLYKAYPQMVLFLLHFFNKIR